MFVIIPISVIKYTYEDIFFSQEIKTIIKMSFYIEIFKIFEKRL